MNDDHLENTFQWLVASPSLRAQVDCLEPPPTRQANAACWQARWSMPSRKDFAIVLDGKEHVGNCGLHDLDLVRGKGQLWLYLGQNHGQGIGTAAVKLLLAMGFRVLRLRRIYLRVVDHNTKALQFYRKLGFVEEGILRHDTHLGTQPVDTHLFSMLADAYFRLFPTDGQDGSLFGNCSAQ